MRIGYNCRFLRGPFTGVQRIAEDLFEALLQIDRENEYVAFLCGRGSRHVNALGRPNVTTVGGDRDVRSRLERQAWEQEALPRLVRGAGVDVMHHPANTAPRRDLRRAVVSIYDTSFLAHPEWFSRPFHWYYRWLMPPIARKAARLITCSQFSKEELVSRLEVDPGRVAVVYPGVSRRFLEAAARPRHDRRDEEPFVLFVGGTNPRKNLPRLVAAMRLLRRDPAHAQVKLKVVGASADIFGTPPAIAEPGNRPEGVEFLGAVSEETLIGLYRGAVCLCYPSLYEGFGLPPLEALACGTPVVAADIPVLREVLADAAAFADPTDVAALAEALARVLDDQALRAEALRHGAQRIGMFTYEAAAKQTLDIYRDVARL